MHHTLTALACLVALPQPPPQAARDQSGSRPARWPGLRRSRAGTATTPLLFKLFLRRLRGESCNETNYNVVASDRGADSDEEVEVVDVRASGGMATRPTWNMSRTTWTRRIGLA